MFANAPIAQDKKPAKAKAKTDIVDTPKVELHAALVAVKKNVEAQIAVVETELKEGANERFVEIGMRMGSKPESYKAGENSTVSTMMLRCRSSASAVSLEEQEILKDNNIPLDTNCIREETFIIKPEYADLSVEANAEMLAKVTEALKDLGLPEDFFMRQTAIEKTIATEESINAVMKLKDKNTVAALLPLVSCTAIRPSLAAGANPFDIVEAALGSPTA